ncbi:Centrin-2 [Erysiphe neolycopersici]|uniref:Calmodulin n=1 Tax=Erysiphe neolycopersici TaxID=212602 RepID=A0A420HEL0_9PEZI|nr:Centrin-2 [Erysiphe neolycopersici]
MDDDNSISDSDGDSSVNSISSSDNSSSIITKKRNKTKATRQKKTQPLSSTRTNRSSNNSDINNKNNKNNNSNAAKLQPNTSRSKLAREHRITATQEHEIHEVFRLFAEESSTSLTSNAATTSANEITSKTGRKSSAKKSNQKNKKNLASALKIHVSNLRRALTALSLTPTADELREYISILDPEGEGVVDYEPFVAICALKINSRVMNNEDHQREVDEAWGLFVKEGNDRITLASLREVARSIGEDGISDELLRDMVLEANGGAGLARGVEKGEFEDVMRKAGVWR